MGVATASLEGKPRAPAAPLAAAAGPAVVALLVALGCYLGQLLAFALRFPPEGLTAVWFPGGVVLAALLLAPPRRWAACALGAAAGLFAALAPEVPPHLALIGPVLAVGHRLVLAAALRRAGPG